VQVAEHGDTVGDGVVQTLMVQTHSASSRTIGSGISVNRAKQSTISGVSPTVLPSHSPRNSDMQERRHRRHPEFVIGVKEMPPVGQAQVSDSLE